MKDKYLEDLKRRLEDYDISRSEREEIISDYAEMIDDAISKNMSEEEIYNLIGTPRKVVQELRDQFQSSRDDSDDFEFDSHKRKDNKIVAIMPFVSVIIYFILGFGWGLWHPGWLVFLLIPMVAIIVNAFDDRKIHGLIALSPFIAVIAFLWLGFGYNLWHPGWLVFLIVPVLGVLAGANKMSFIALLTALSPFAATAAYMLIGFLTGVWHPTWLIFLIIPVLGALNEKSLLKILIYEISIIGAAGLYLYIGYTTGEWRLSLLVFLIPLGISIMFGDTEVRFSVDKEHRIDAIMFILFLAIYFVFGYFFNTWAYLWMIFLAIPVYEILKHAPIKENKLVAIMPFIATVIFFVLGYFFGWWQYSWMAFFLIPITAIIKNA